MSQRRPQVRTAALEDGLLRKYRELLRKHEQLVERLQERTSEHVSTWTLSSWALRMNASGLTLMRDGAVRLANARWHALGRASDGGWRRLAPPGPDSPLYPDLNAVARDESHAVLEHPGIAPRLTRYRREDGGQVLEMRTERVGPEKELLTLVMAHDITEQVRAEEELARARAERIEREHLHLLGEMASGIAHDLGNTLNAMRLRLELIERDSEFAERQRGNMDALARIVADAHGRVQQLREFSRQRPEPQGPGEPVHLEGVVHEAVEIARSDLEHRATREGLKLRVAMEVPALPPVRGSAAELRYVLINLLLNARDAMPRGGTIRVRGGTREGKVFLTVEDEGTGIPEENLQAIFRPFFTTKGEQGTGLGLAMAYGVVSRAGGTITAANRPEGGARFTLTFPALGEPKPDTKAKARKKPTASPTRKQKRPTTRRAR